MQRMEDGKRGRKKSRSTNGEVMYLIGIADGHSEDDTRSNSDRGKS